MTPLYDGYSSTYETNALGVSEASCRFSRNADNGGAIDEATSQSVMYDTTRGTARVGSYEPNAWGLYDMLGNVSELCHDFYNALSRYETMTVDPDGFTNSRDGNSTYRVTCGGSCRQLSIECRPSRVYSQQDWLYSTEEYVGFRPVYILP
jgi:formylglycine-generating enzyme required for sulfatase activity